MTELDKWITRLNLLLTNTCDLEHLDMKLIPDIKDSISFYDLINIFNQLYLSYRQYVDYSDREKYQFLMDLYDRLNSFKYRCDEKVYMLFGNALDTVFVEIMSDKTQLKSLEVTISTYYSCYKEESVNSLKVYFKLGENLEVNGFRSELMLDNQYINVPDDDYIRLLKRIYINRIHLLDYSNRFDEEKVKALNKYLR